jgi:phosphoribosylanthranilate isomerase
MVRVKICGITNLEDALLACSIGVDALGFVFASSPRRIDPQEASNIIRSLPPFVTTVGVFVNEEPAVIEEIARRCLLDFVQLHGDESAELCQQLTPKTIKAFQLRDEEMLSTLASYRGRVGALLFDAYSETKRGGTGAPCNWNLAIKGKEPNIPVILSGGLNPDNIQAAVLDVRPFGVDVSSGIEDAPGRKNPDLMRAFMDKIEKLNRGGTIDV